ncbi:MAG: VOC family protein [Deltaproteobacteria bacterium]|nr:VOC family protein [Deltaproteobacteria bacterium]
MSWTSTRTSGAAIPGLCAALVAFCACASTEPVRLPPITETATQLTLPGKFVWLDLVTGDLAVTKHFYGELFGWKFEEDADYLTVLHRGSPIAGVVLMDPDGAAKSSAWIGSLSVVDVDRAAEIVRAGGGAVERGPIDAVGRGRAALVRDPGGAHLMLLHASSGDPPDVEPSMGGWLWRELWTRDATEALAFYGSLASYDERPAAFDGYRYVVLEQAGRPRAAIVEAPMEKVDPLWLPYVRVEDPAAMVARAGRLGATVILQDEDAAILLDPSGAAFGVQRWSPKPDAGEAGQ